MGRPSIHSLCLHEGSLTIASLLTTETADREPAFDLEVASVTKQPSTVDSINLLACYQANFEHGSVMKCVLPHMYVQYNKQIILLCTQKQQLSSY